MEPVKSEVGPEHENKPIQIIKYQLIRNLVIILDLSSFSYDRIENLPKVDIIVECAKEIIQVFLEKNPLGFIAILYVKDGQICNLCPVSNSVPELQISLDNVPEPSGSFSLHKAIYTSMMLFKTFHLVGYEEMVVLMTSVHTVDSDDLFGSKEWIVKSGIRVSIIHFSAEVFICKEIVGATNGLFEVFNNSRRLSELVDRLCEPKPLPPNLFTSHLKMVGFPTFVEEDYVCFCHLELRKKGYVCPQCGNVVCSLPLKCPVCSLLLITSHNLAMLFHVFLGELTMVAAECSAEAKCYGCNFQTQGDGGYVCEKCQKLFCSVCYEYIHKSVWNCPGCV